MGSAGPRGPRPAGMGDGKPGWAPGSGYQTHLPDLFRARWLEVHLRVAAVGLGPVLELDALVPVDLTWGGGLGSWQGGAPPETPA